MLNKRCANCGRTFESVFVWATHDCRDPYGQAELAGPLYVLVRLDEVTEQESHVMTSYDHASLRAMADRGNSAPERQISYDVALASDLEPQAGL